MSDTDILPQDTGAGADDSIDMLEAKSLRYSNAVVMILPLASGNFALVDRSFTVRAISVDIPTASEIRAMSETFAKELKQPAVDISDEGIHIRVAKKDNLVIDIDI